MWTRQIINEHVNRRGGFTRGALIEGMEEGLWEVVVEAEIGVTRSKSCKSQGKSRGQGQFKGRRVRMCLCLRTRRSPVCRGVSGQQGEKPETRAGRGW